MIWLYHLNSKEFEVVVFGGQVDLDLGGGVVASIGVQPETDLEVEQNRGKGGWGGKLSADQVIFPTAGVDGMENRGMGWKTHLS